MRGRGMGLPSNTFTISIPKGLRALINKLAEAYEVTPGDIVRVAITIYATENLHQIFLEGPELHEARTLLARVQDHFRTLTDNEE